MVARLVLCAARIQADTAMHDGGDVIGKPPSSPQSTLQFLEPSIRDWRRVPLFGIQPIDGIDIQ